MALHTFLIRQFTDTMHVDVDAWLNQHSQIVQHVDNTLKALLITRNNSRKGCAPESPSCRSPGFTSYRNVSAGAHNVVRIDQRDLQMSIRNSNKIHLVTISLSASVSSLLG